MPKRPLPQLWAPFSPTVQVNMCFMDGFLVFAGVFPAVTVISEMRDLSFLLRTPPRHAKYSTPFPVILIESAPISFLMFFWLLTLELNLLPQRPYFSQTSMYLSQWKWLICPLPRTISPHSLFFLCRNVSLILSHLNLALCLFFSLFTFTRWSHQ